MDKTRKSKQAKVIIMMFYSDNWLEIGFIIKIKSHKTKMRKK